MFLKLRYIDPKDRYTKELSSVSLLIYNSPKHYFEMLYVVGITNSTLEVMGHKVPKPFCKGRALLLR